MTSNKAFPTYNFTIFKNHMLEERTYIHFVVQDSSEGGNETKSGSRAHLLLTIIQNRIQGPGSMKYYFR